MNPTHHHNDAPCDSTNCVLCGYVICAFCEFGLDPNSVCWLNRFRAREFPSSGVDIFIDYIL